MKLLINRNWETADTIEECAKIVRENYNDQLADRLEELAGTTADEEIKAAIEELGDVNTSVLSAVDALRRALN